MDDKSTSEALHRAIHNYFTWAAIHKKTTEELARCDEAWMRPNLTVENMLEIRTDRSVFTAQQSNARLNLNNYLLQVIGLIPKRTLIVLRAATHFTPEEVHPDGFEADVKLLRALKLFKPTNPPELSLEGSIFLLHLTQVSLGNDDDR